MNNCKIDKSVISAGNRARLGGCLPTARVKYGVILSTLISQRQSVK